LNKREVLLAAALAALVAAPAVGADAAKENATASPRLGKTIAPL